jgi:hypothetical protein
VSVPDVNLLVFEQRLQQFHLDPFPGDCATSKIPTM